MKKYIIPEITIKSVNVEKDIASLSAWLEGNEYQEAGITTFEYNS